MRTMAMISRGTAVLVTLVALLLPSAAQAGGCAGLAFSSAQKNAGAFDTTFSATKVLDVDLFVLFTPGVVNRFSAGDHQLEVRVFTPRGFLYQSIAIPFTSDSTKHGKPQKLDGYPHAKPVQGLRDVTFGKGKFLGTAVRLPVGGTMISTNSLYGTWQAEAFIDGEALKCSQPATFSITP